MLQIKQSDLLHITRCQQLQDVYIQWHHVSSTTICRREELLSGVQTRVLEEAVECPLQPLLHHPIVEHIFQNSRHRWDSG